MISRRLVSFFLLCVQCLIYGVLFSFYFADSYQRAPQVPTPGLLRQVLNLVDTLVAWERLLWFLIQERQVSPQKSEEGPSWHVPASGADPSAMEAASVASRFVRRVERHMTFVRSSIGWYLGISHPYLLKSLVAVPIQYLQLIV